MARNPNRKGPSNPNATGYEDDLNPSVPRPFPDAFDPLSAGHRGWGTEILTLPRGGRRIVWNSPHEVGFGDHLERYLGPCSVVIHGTGLGLHLYVYPPSGQRESWACVTMGLSGHRMKTPSDMERPEQWRLCELMCYLPADWEPPQGLTGEVTEENWPLQMIREIARYVVEVDSYITESHGLCNMIGGDKPLGTPFVPGSELTSTILLWPFTEHEDVAQYDAPNPHTGEEECINLYLAVPVTDKEWERKREMGFKSLIPLLENGRIPIECRTWRKSAV